MLSMYEELQSLRSQIASTPSCPKTGTPTKNKGIFYTSILYMYKVVTEKNSIFLYLATQEKLFISIINITFST